MCMACWEEYGSPRIDNARVREAVRAIREVYGFSCVGGNLHCQLDDWNLEDDFFGEFIVDHEDASEAQLEAERRCFDLMKPMSLRERASALALEDGFWGGH